MAHKKIPIAVAHGDGIGPEIMEAVLHVMKAADAPLEIHEVQVGEKVYLSGEKTGMAKEMWDVIRKCDAFLKAPITTPQGGGFKSLNVTIRTTLGLYANVRPCVAYQPYVRTKHPGMDVVIIRENEEDLYAGIEYRQTPSVYQALKLISTQGCEKIIRYAFEYAKANRRKKVTCFSKDNILKLTDGHFHKVFDRIAKEYPELENEHWIIDIGAAKLADTPEAFDVIVMANLYGDILSDVGAQIAGSVGLAGSANIGEHGAMFEAIHGSAPRRAGQNMANPSGLLLAAVQMLAHIGLPDHATAVHNAWLKTIEDGVHTYDIFKEGVSKEKVGTREFAEAIAKNLGKKPSTLKSARYSAPSKELFSRSEEGEAHVKTELKGVDVYVRHKGPVDQLAEKLKVIEEGALELAMILNRGVKVWPDTMPETSCVDQWRCRFMGKKGLKHSDIAALLSRLSVANIDFLQIQNLNDFDGEPGYSVTR